MPKTSNTEKNTATVTPPAKKGGKNVVAADKNVVVPAGITFDGEVQKIQDGFAEGEGAEWHMGEAYDNIVTYHLAEAAGTRALNVVKQLYRDIGQSTLSGYRRVKKAFPLEMAKKYGMSRLSQLLTYEQHAHAAPIQGDPGQVQIDVPQKDGTTAKKAFADCTMRELREATAGAKGPSSVGTISAADQKLIAQYQKALDSYQGAHGPAHLRAKAGPRETVLDLTGIPVDSFMALMTELTKVLVADSVNKIPKVPKIPSMKPARKSKTGKRR